VVQKDELAGYERERRVDQRRIQNLFNENNRLEQELEDYQLNQDGQDARVLILERKMNLLKEASDNFQRLLSE